MGWGAAGAGSGLVWLCPCLGAGVPVGCAPTARQEPTQAEEGVWVVWILAFCFGLGRSFWSLSLLKWISLGAPLPVPVVQSHLSEQTGPLLHATVPEVLQGSLKKAHSLFSSLPSRFSYRKAELWLYIPMSAHCVVVSTTGVKSGLCWNPALLSRRGRILLWPSKTSGRKSISLWFLSFTNKYTA